MRIQPRCTTSSILDAEDYHHVIIAKCTYNEIQRERPRQSETDRQTDRQSERERERWTVCKQNNNVSITTCSILSRKVYKRSHNMSTNTDRYQECVITDWNILFWSLTHFLVRLQCVLSRGVKTASLLLSYVFIHYSDNQI